MILLLIMANIVILFFIIYISYCVRRIISKSVIDVRVVAGKCPGCGYPLAHERGLERSCSECGVKSSDVVVDNVNLYLGHVIGLSLLFLICAGSMAVSKSLPIAIDLLMQEYGKASIDLRYFDVFQIVVPAIAVFFSVWALLPVFAAYWSEYRSSSK